MKEWVQESKESNLSVEEAQAPKTTHTTISPWQRFFRVSRSWLPGSVIFLIALCFNLYRLGSASIWFDEAFSVELARQPLPQLLRLIFGPEPNMELYYLFLHFWLRLTALLGWNPTEIVVRLPSALFAAGSAVIIFALGRRFISTAAGLLGALLYVLNCVQLIYAQQTRSYSLQLLLMALSWYILLAALTTERRHRLSWSSYVLVTVLALYTHLFSILLVVAQFVFVVGLFIVANPWRERVRRHMVSFLLSMLAFASLSIPMILLSLGGGNTSWLPSPHPGDVVRLFYSFAGYNKAYAIVLLAGCALCVVFLAGAYLSTFLRENVAGSKLRSWFKPFERFVPICWMLLCWLLLPLLISYVVSQGATRLFSARYLVVIVPAFCLLIGLLIAGLRGRIIPTVLSLVVLALALVATPYYYASAQVEDWNSTVPWMQQRYQPDDGLVCYDNTINGPIKQGCQISVEYYFHAYPTSAHFTSDAPGAFSWTTYSAPNPEAALDPAALAAYGSQHPHLFFIVGRVQDGSTARLQAAQQWLDTHYRLLGQTSTRTVTIRWYATTPP